MYLFFFFSSFLADWAPPGTLLPLLVGSDITVAMICTCIEYMYLSTYIDVAYMYFYTRVFHPNLPEVHRLYLGSKYLK